MTTPAPAKSDTPAPTDKPVYLPPGVRPGELPPFYLLGEYVFQDLCRDLLDADPDVAYCDVYGRRGQRQHGIDLRAPLSRNEGHDVAQCKCYEKFTPPDVRAASDEFLSHWSHWSTLNVRRFILIVACDLSDKQVQDELIRQGARFKALGVEYAVWSAAKIRNLLRPHRGLVGSYFKPAEVWVREICGPEAAPEISVTPSRSADIQSAATMALLEHFAEVLSGNVSQQVEALRDAWREGRAADALAGVLLLKKDKPVWSVLSPEAKARVLRFEASLVLDQPGGLARATELAAEARALAPADDHSRIDAIIVHRTHGAAAALAVLGEPMNADARHLAAVLLLEQSLTAEAIDTLDNDRHGFEATADTFRLQALTYAAARDFDRARLASQRALELAPHWESVRTAAGVVEYFSALSPGVRPSAIPSWPSPPGWSFVQRDDESLLRLRTAAERFSSLRAQSQRTAAGRETYETWYLACLANDPERQDEAASLTRQLLQTNPTHAGAIAWALARSYDIELEPVEQALVTRIHADPDEIQAVISMVMCLLVWERSMDAVELLRTVRPRFEAHRHMEWWGFWYGQAILGSGEAESQDFLDYVDMEDGQQLRLLALRMTAERTGEWGSVADALESEHERTGHAPYLFEACVAWMRIGEWGTVAERAESLVSAVGTAEAVHLSVVAAQNARRTELVVRLLDDNRHRFPHHKLPRDLRVIRTRALYAQGELGQAVEEARELAREEDTLPNQLRLAQLLSTKGELSELAALIRKIAKRTDISSDDALRLARTVAVDDIDLAIQLWRTANLQGIADESVGPALDLAYRLELEDETRDLIERMDRLAREGLYGHQIHPTSDLPALATAWNREREQAVEAYRAGMLPVHLFADRVQVPLAALYRHNLTVHERNPRPATQFPLCIQHGMRALSSRFSEPPVQWRLHADITALLLAAHLGILEEVERAFGPIWIPDSSIFDLTRMRDKLVPQQPSRLRHNQQVIKLVDDGRIVTHGFNEEARTSDLPWREELGDERAGMVAHAIMEDGYLVDYPADSSPNLPDEVRSRTVTPHAVVHALRQYGPLSETEQLRALRELGTEGTRAAETGLPKSERPLYCHGNTAELLASAGVLHHACDRFRVQIDGDMLREIRDQQNFYEERAGEVRWLSALIEHLSTGENDGRYRIIPPVLTEPHNSNQMEELYGFRTLLEFTPKPGDAIWVDDRWATGYWMRDEASVIGSIQVLGAMLSAGSLNRVSYYDALTRLRAANARYVPISAREIVHHLVDAELNNDGVVETYSLSVLRRYSAAWLRDAKWLDRPLREDGLPNPKSEMPLIMGFNHAVTRASRHLLVRGNADRKARLARVRWLMESLYVDHASIRRHAELATPTDDATRSAAISAVGFVIQGISFGWEMGSRGRKLRRRYLGWVWRSILRSRSDADRLFLPLVAEFLKNTPLFQFSDNDLSTETRIVARRQIYNDLPRRLRDELAKDPEFQRQIAIQTLPVVNVQEISIERTAFILGAAEAVNGRTGFAVLAGSDRTVHFAPADPGSGYGFRITGAFEGGEIHLGDEVFGVLSESASEREAVLRRNPDWFDGPAEMWENWIAATASTEDPTRRFLDAERGRDTSPTRHYWKLVQQLRATQSYHRSDLTPPAIERLLRSFRLETDAPIYRKFRHTLTVQADAIIAELGLEAALERWAGLPVPLPSAFREAVALLGNEERRKLVRGLLRLAGSPVSDLHLIRLLWSLRDIEPSFGRLAQARARRLLSKEDDALKVETFIAILRWVGETFALRVEVAHLPVELRLGLVWLHAHRVFTAFTASAADMTRLGEQFRSAMHRFSSRAIFDDGPYQSDACAPERLERLPFLLNGLSYAFAGTHPGEIGAGLAGMADELFFFDSDGTRVPHVHLLRDLSLAGNALGSFLHSRRERALRAILQPDHASLLSSRGLKKMMGQLLEAVHPNSNTPAAWLHIWAVAGDLPLRAGQAATLNEIIRSTDFESLVRREPLFGGFALQTAAAAAAHDSDPASRSRMGDVVLSIARGLRERYPHVAGELLDHDGPVPAAPFVTQAAVELSKWSGDRAAVLAEFAELLSNLIGAWPALAKGIGAFAQRAWDELPPEEGVLFGDIVVRARAVA